jgi:plastocyanin
MRRTALSYPFAMITATLFAACSGSATPTPAASAAAPSSAASAAASTAASTAASGGASGGGGAGCAVAPAGSTAAVTITIKDFKYSPAPAQAKVGDVVAWTNSDSAPHSATMDNGACDTDTISPGSTAMLVFNAPGTYTYHCKVHPAQMKDVTIVVQ